MKCKIFVVVRTGSKRLPRKALLKIKDKPTIKILTDRLKSNKKHEIIVCTTKKKSDNKLAQYLTRNNITVFRGSEKDILKRLDDAATKYRTNQFVVVEGDDIFCDPDLVYETCKKLHATKNEFLYWENLPFGASPVGIKAEKLKFFIQQKMTKNTETGWIKFIIDSGFFKVRKLLPKTSKLQRPDIRLSIDYREDFDLAKKLLELLPKKFTLSDIIVQFNKNPNLLDINASVKKKYFEDFERKRIKKGKSL